MGSAANGTPKQRIAAECARHRPRPLTDACVALLEGRPDDVGDVMITATEAVIAATGDDAWRVREMAAKVIAAHQVAGAFDAGAALRAGEVHRVRAAAARAVTLLTAAGA